MTRGPGLSSRIYGALLRLYPKGLQDGFAQAQAETFEDWLSEARARRGLAGVAGVWREAVGDWAWSMLLAHREATSPAQAVQFVSGLFLAAALAMWALIAASMLGHLNWATDFVENHTRPNTWVALGAPCAALLLAAVVNPWRAGRISMVLKVSAAASASAWWLALTTWRG